MSQSVSPVYRPYSDVDFPFCNSLIMRNMGGYFRALDIQWNPDRYRAFLAEGIAYIVNWEHQIGFFHLTAETDHMYLHNVQLAEAYQGQGIGSLVLDEIERRCLQEEKHTIRLSVFKENPAWGLYTRRGFKWVKDRGYKVLLEKRLLVEGEN